MEKLRIEGRRPLSGEVPIGGAKNAALPALAATLLTADTVTLRNVPDVRDVGTTCKLLEQLGAAVERPEPGMVVVRGAAEPDHEARYDLVKTMRASFLVLGPMLARCGRARVSLPGGCAIGARPVDRHLAAFTRMGAVLEMSAGYVEARCERLHGAEIVFEVPTVGGTENCMMAATLAEGRTVLRNAARGQGWVAARAIAGALYGIPAMIGSRGANRANPAGAVAIARAVDWNPLAYLRG